LLSSQGHLPFAVLCNADAKSDHLLKVMKQLIGEYARYQAAHTGEDASKRKEIVLCAFDSGLLQGQGTAPLHHDSTLGNNT
jgi:hypothetical protein